MDDNMISEIIEQMLGETEGETDKNLFPPEPGKDGHTVTITISQGGAKAEPAPMKEEEPEDGGYDALMKGLQ